MHIAQSPVGSELSFPISYSVPYTVEGFICRGCLICLYFRLGLATASFSLVPLSWVRPVGFIIDFFFPGAHHFQSENCLIVLSPLYIQNIWPACLSYTDLFWQQHYIWHQESSGNCGGGCCPIPPTGKVGLCGFVYSMLILSKGVRLTYIDLNSPASCNKSHPMVWHVNASR